MSISYFGYTGPTSFVIPTDLVISENNPGLILLGSEASAQWSEVREVAGVLWLVRNAKWNGSSWVQNNTAAISTGISLDTSGNINYLYCASSTPNITWTTVASTTDAGAAAFASVAASGNVGALTVQSKAGGATLAYTPAVYTLAGAATGTTEHIVRGNISIPITPAGNSTYSAVLTITGMTFSSASSYQAFGTLNNIPAVGFSTVPVVTILRNSGSTLTVSITSGNNSASTGSASVDYLLIGT